MLTPTSLGGMGLDKTVALITDGRFQVLPGCGNRSCVSQAAARGPIAAIKEGDIISIDIPNNKLEMKLTDEEINKRIAALSKHEARFKTGYLARYTKMLHPASTALFY